MFFTLAVSARTADACGALTSRAVGTDPRTVPVPGPARLAWRSADGTAALIEWGARAAEGRPAPAVADGSAAPAGGAGIASGGPGGDGAAAGSALRAAASHAGTIWSAGPAAEIHARTSITRIDPVYLARLPSAVVLSDRASWAAAVAERITEADPAAVSAIVNMGFPLGDATPFRGVRALAARTRVRASAGEITETVEPSPETGAAGVRDAASEVASALVAAVAPVRGRPDPVDLSLTGGKDSRLIAAVLHAAGVPFRARTYGFPGHPDVVVAGLAARRLGVEHEVTEPRVTASSTQRVDVLGRLRSSVLVGDGMLSAFENLGGPDRGGSGSRPDLAPVLGGQGGELLRGGYARITAARIAQQFGAAEQMGPLAGLTRSAVATCRDTAASAVLLRRLAMRRSRLLRAGPRLAYLAALAPWFGSVGRDPHLALDDFYLVNRAGRWSAAARQAYAIAAPVVQPLFDHWVVRAARSAPIRDRLNDRLIHAVIGELCPPLLDVPLAGGRWKFDAAAPPSAGPEHDAWLARAPVTMPRGQPQRRAGFDWRRRYGIEVAQFLRGYVLDQEPAGELFGVVSRRAAERMLRVPHADPDAVWALATMAALASGDWLSARDQAGRTFEVPVPS